MATSEPSDASQLNTSRHVLPLERALALLRDGEMESHGLLPYSSNYTFLATVRENQASDSTSRDGEGTRTGTADSEGTLAAMVVYKPRQGERPLWDFPRGTLCQREVAAYLVSQALGWNLVPPTVLRDGPYGPGMVQLYIEHNPEEHFFTFRDEVVSSLPRIALFDVVVNNADRKGGHFLRDATGHVWCIDHGITFHVEPKLRTVLWDFAGQPIAPDLLDDLSALESQLAPGQVLNEALAQLLSADECESLRKRVRRLIRVRRFPNPGPGRHVPWPMV